MVRGEERVVSAEWALTIADWDISCAHWLSGHGCGVVSPHASTDGKPFTEPEGWNASGLPFEIAPRRQDAHHGYGFIACKERECKTQCDSYRPAHANRSSWLSPGHPGKGPGRHQSGIGRQWRLAVPKAGMVQSRVLRWPGLEPQCTIRPLLERPRSGSQPRRASTVGGWAGRPSAR